MLQDLATAVGVIATLVGGGWVLVGRYSELKEKLENQRHEHVNSAISRVAETVRELSLVQDSYRRATEEAIAGLRAEIHSLKLAQTEHSASMREFNQGLERAYEHFAGVVNQAVQSEKVRIGKDAILIRDKKPKE